MRLAEEHAALRRVATLVAHGVSSPQVFDAVAEEAGRLLGVASTELVRFESDETVTLVAGWGRLAELVPVGTRLRLGGINVISEVARSGRPARLDRSVRATGAIGEHARGLDVRESVGVPITVGGRLWGAMTTAAGEGAPLPPDVELRLARFTELVAAAVANAEARAELARLADEQAALRRVATLVAQEAPVAELFAKVAEEVPRVLGPRVDSAILRYDADGTATVVAVWGEQPAAGIRVGARLPVDGSGVTARVLRERRPVRVDEYAAAGGAIADHAREHGIRAAVGCPIVIRNRLWGALVVAHYESEPFPADTERRVAQFTELLSTAIANAQARAELQRLAEEQAALRRVATLVAQGAPADELLAAVAHEIAVTAPIEAVHIYRYEPGGDSILLATWSTMPERVPVGARHAFGGHNIPTLVYRTGQAARIDDMAPVTGTAAAIVRRLGLRSVVGCPIVVEGRLWGLVVAATTKDDSIPADTEQRIADFTELVATAIANADGRAQLAASRARVVAAATEERRRIVRDLHDGAQQRLVHTSITLQLALRELGPAGGRAEAFLREALEQADAATSELRELVHGILPRVLTHGGLRAGLDALASRSALPVTVEVGPERYPAAIEATAYFVVSEALTNAVKHAGASTVAVTACVEHGRLRVEVRDNGDGGADPGGSGLTGLRDRVEALGGSIELDSPAGGGTSLVARMPIEHG